MQDRPQAPRQVCLAERFVHDRELAYRLMSFQHIPRVARGEQDLDAFAQPPRFAGKLNAVHAVWHHDIAKQQLKFLATLVHPDEERRKGPDLRAVRAYPSSRCLPVAVLVGK